MISVGPAPPLGPVVTPVATAITTGLPASMPRTCRCPLTSTIITIHRGVATFGSLQQHSCAQVVRRAPRTASARLLSRRRVSVRHPHTPLSPLSLRRASVAQAPLSPPHEHTRADRLASPRQLTRTGSSPPFPNALSPTFPAAACRCTLRRPAPWLGSRWRCSCCWPWRRLPRRPRAGATWTWTWTWTWASSPPGGRRRECRGTVAECLAEASESEEEGLDLVSSAESHRRALYGGGYISYGALRRDNVPCSRRGASYYNCRPGGQANPYHRGCSRITRCRG
uniref:Rapid alkalinization factor n=1 Tax=Saccharum hybrid cultivar R570 TaxID=131158 RepID=A0A059Q278_9POAL|nr:hypothetical protein SHCRBa_256_D11_F_160 [Saccharum hybrid cultivar R570]AGT17389.1 hypothetical protein SHCRBa_176_L06_R_120 [Saccharum hybrid cultivar R570]